jgi:hypothetical protein
MIRFLSDHDIELYVRLLWAHFSDEDWHDLGVEACHTFDEVGIYTSSSDRDVWLYCQSNNLLLITGNRNMQGNDSLEATIRELTKADSLPVVTIAQPEMLLDSTYREDCAYRIADIVAELPNLLGSQRQIIP